MYNYPEYIKNNCSYFTKLAKTKSERKKNKLIEEADFDKLLGIVEICSNILKGNIDLKLRQRKKLSKNADFYRKVSRSRGEKTTKKHLQTGGSALALAAIIAPVLGQLGQYVLDKTLLKE